jgi:transcription factor IIIB subunit 2
MAKDGVDKIEADPEEEEDDEEEDDYDDYEKDDGVDDAFAGNYESDYDYGDDDD